MLMLLSSVPYSMQATNTTRKEITRVITSRKIRVITSKEIAKVITSREVTRVITSREVNIINRITKGTVATISRVVTVVIDMVGAVVTDRIIRIAANNKEVCISTKSDVSNS